MTANEDNVTPEPDSQDYSRFAPPEVRSSSRAVPTPPRQSPAAPVPVPPANGSGVPPANTSVTWAEPAIVDVRQRAHDTVHFEEPADPTLESVQGDPRRWVNVSRSVAASLCAALAVAALVAGSVVSGVWQTFTDPEQYANVARDAYNDDAIPDAITDLIVNALWEQNPAETVLADLNMALASPGARESFPEDFENIAGAIQDTETLEMLVNEWLPPYVNTLVKSDQGMAAWVNANESAHAALMERFEWKGTRSGAAPKMDLGAYRELWRDQSTGVAVVDYMVENLNLEVSFIDSRTRSTLQELYGTGKVLRIAVPIAGAVLLAVGLFLARRRHWFLIGTGAALLIASFASEIISKIPGAVVNFESDNALGNHVFALALAHVPAASHSAFYLVAILGSVLFAAGIVSGSIRAIRKRSSI